MRLRQYCTVHDSLAHSAIEGLCEGVNLLSRFDTHDLCEFERVDLKPLSGQPSGDPTELDRANSIILHLRREPASIRGISAQAVQFPWGNEAR